MEYRKKIVKGVHIDKNHIDTGFIEERTEPYMTCSICRADNQSGFCCNKKLCIDITAGSRINKKCPRRCETAFNGLLYCYVHTTTRELPQIGKGGIQACRLYSGKRHQGNDDQTQ